MQPAVCSTVWVVAGVASMLPALGQTQDANAGKQLFAQCSVCHSIDGSNGVGPGLKGSVGGNAGSVAGFRYSRAMKASGVTWDAKNLDTYLAEPQKLVPGNIMPFSGVADAKQRADIVAYLQTLK